MNLADFMFSTGITIPVFQIVLLLGISTLILLTGRAKMALIVNYVFTLYWGYFINRDSIFADADIGYQVVTWYFGLGILVAVLAMFGFMANKE